MSEAAANNNTKTPEIYTLYGEIQKAMSSNKTLLGYTVKDYSTEALAGNKKAKKKNAENANLSSDSLNVTNVETNYTRRYTDMLALVNQTNVDFEAAGNSNYIFTKKTESNHNQMLCILKGFSGTIAQITNGSGSAIKLIKQENGNSTQNSHAKNGVSLLQSGRQSFYEMNDQKIKELNDKRIGLDTQYAIGIGFDLSIGQNFMNHFYENLGCDVSKLSSIAAKGALLAEICILGDLKKDDNTYQSGTGGAYTNVQVVHNIPYNANQQMPTVWFPHLLWSLSTYQKNLPDNHWGIKVVDNGSKTVKINDVGATCPISDSKYYHKEGKIYNFTPRYLRDNVNTDANSDACCKIVKSGGADSLIRLRLYFNDQKRQDVQSILGAEKVKQYQNQIFKGFLKQQAIREQKISITGDEINLGEVRAAIGQGSPAAGKMTDSCFYYQGQVNWNSKYLTTNKPEVVQLGTMIESIAKAYNINTRMFLAQICLESGYLVEPLWKQGRNPGGLKSPHGAIKKEDARPMGKQYANVTAWADREATDGGYFLCFYTPQDGLNAKACQVVNNESFGGINVKKYKTVGDYYTGIQGGKRKYAMEGSDYTKLLMRIYEGVLGYP